MGCLETSIYKKEIEVILGDVRNNESVNNAVSDCASLFHLAALIGIPYSYESHKAYIDRNIIGTYNILPASKEHEPEQILITSISETYGTAKYIPIDEKHPLSVQSPYFASKITANQLALSYYLSFNSPNKNYQTVQIQSTAIGKDNNPISSYTVSIR